MKWNRKKAPEPKTVSIGGHDMEVEQWTRPEDIKRNEEREKLRVAILPGRRGLYRGKDTGLIFYPAFPEPLQGTSEAWRPDFDITHPDDWPQWVKNMHTEGATVEVTPDGTVIWWGGTVHDGMWMPQGRAYWMGGCWRDGIWMSGDWLGGLWAHGDWRGGTFHAGVWRDGNFRAGTFRGLWQRGLWLGGTFDGYWQRTQTPPSVDFGV